MFDCLYLGSEPPGAAAPPRAGERLPLLPQEVLQLLHEVLRAQVLVVHLLLGKVPRKTGKICPSFSENIY